MVAATNNQVIAWKFIETESTGGAGYQGERIVWDTLRQNLTQGEGVVIWGYRAFSQEERTRREMDILVVRYPDWDIALVFFTRSLYNLIIELVDQWLRYFSGGEVCYNAKSSKLKVLSR